MSSKTPVPLQLCDEQPTGDATFSKLGQVQALLDNPALYELGKLIGEPDKCKGGRPRRWPGFVFILCNALISTHQSARQLEKELGKTLWHEIRDEVAKRFPNNPELHLCATPPKRHNIDYIIRKWIIGSETFENQLATFAATACKQALEAGFCDENGRGSYAEPARERTLYGDGTVDRPMIKKSKNKKCRQDPDASHHVTGTGPKTGNATVSINVRGNVPKMRFILGVRGIGKGQNEADVSIALLGELAEQLSGAQHVTWDGAFRGTHLAKVFQMGLVGSSRLHKSKGERTSKNLGVHKFTPTNGTSRARDATVFAIGGVAHIAEYDDEGSVHYTALSPTRILRQQNKDGLWRWYGKYELRRSKDALSEGTLTLRLNDGEEENLSFIGYDKTIGWRVDAENVHRTRKRRWEDGRATSLGARRQLFDVTTHSLLWNSQTRVQTRYTPIYVEEDQAKPAESQAAVAA